MADIGVFEAKTHFSSLVDRAKNGEACTITHRGVVVARLVPLTETRDTAKAREALGRPRARTSSTPARPYRWTKSWLGRMQARADNGA